jgi:hypothetical protein
VEGQGGWAPLQVAHCTHVCLELQLEQGSLLVKIQEKGGHWGTQALFAKWGGIYLIISFCFVQSKLRLL